MPQPIDAPSEIGRAIIAERVQAASDRAATGHQIRTTDDVQEKRIESETQVQETPETESERVDGDGRRRNPYVGRRRRKGKKSGSNKQKVAAKEFYTADERKEESEDPQAHSFDVSV